MNTDRWISLPAFNYLHHTWSSIAQYMCRANCRFVFFVFSYIQNRMTIIFRLLLLFCGDSVTMSWFHRIILPFFVHSLLFLLQKARFQLSIRFSLSLLVSPFSLLSFFHCVHLMWGDLLLFLWKYSSRCDGSFTVQHIAAR